MATSSIEAGKLFAVDGLVAVITGGGSGIGLMMARALALNGAHKVYIVGRRKDVLDKAAASVTTGNIVPLVGDVTSKDSLASVVAQVEKETGYINVLVANSGTLGPKVKTTINIPLEDFQAQFWKTDVEEYSQTFATNVSGVFYTVIAFLGLLDKGNKKGNVEQKSQVIATSSIGSFNRATPGGYAYGQSKAAVTHLSKQLATGLVPYSIRSNVLAPGLYPSDLAQPILDAANNHWTKDKIPLERVGTEEDMAGCILFLTSRAGAYLTGNVLVTDGGRLSVTPATY